MIGLVLENRGARWRIHLDKAFSGMRANQITTAGVKAFITDRLEDEAANATINRELAALRRMFRLGAQQTPPLVGQVPNIPMLKEKNSRRGFLEHDQFLDLHKALPDYLKNFVYFAYITGWRKTEISILTWSHIDRKNWTVRLEPGETKNEDARTVYADKNLKQIIRDQWVSRHKQKLPLEWVFPNRWGKDRLRQFDKVWKNALDTAKLDPTLIFHDLRRTAVRNMVRAGIPERVADIGSQNTVGF
ncbi:MAG: tyrosine-type recombinase/integrase [Proteobacteria bacterium]|nr:tyrosine-type recombinase/integrase [Pseudomonadota bacterium]MBU4469442.1 tyrosine-type recombinase/integrase [Pseudomonadota bacterium]MCG2752343.1 tyrosine-type recombinase/integrase [Desulfobacteraceae bacterium]